MKLVRLTLAVAAVSALLSGTVLAGDCPTCAAPAGTLLRLEAAPADPGYNPVPPVALPRATPAVTLFRLEAAPAYDPPPAVFLARPAYHAPAVAFRAAHHDAFAPAGRPDAFAVAAFRGPSSRLAFQFRAPPPRQQFDIRLRIRGR